MTGGAERSVRERGKGVVGLGWLGVSWAGWLPGPKWLLGLFLFIFFFMFSFSFVSEICFEFLKRLLYSDLNKSHADHFWSLESVFTTYKPEV
jgi:hypothetical protein